MMTSSTPDYTFTNGGDDSVRHERLIGIGGNGEVHKVYDPAKPILITDVRPKE